MAAVVPAAAADSGWTALPASLPSGFAAGEVVVDGAGHLFVFGVPVRGWDAGSPDCNCPPTPTGYAYDAPSGGWMPITSRFPSYQGPAAAGPDGRIYFWTTRYGSGHTQVLDPATGSWEQRPTALGRVVDAVAAPGGQFLLVNNASVPGGYVPVVHTYDPTADTVGPAVNGPAGTAAVIDGALSGDGLLYIRRADGSMVGFDPSTDTWNERAPNPAPTEGSSLAATDDGRVCEMGGSVGQLAVHDVECYDPATDTWGPAPPLGTARWNSTAASGPDGHLYVAGGFLLRYAGVGPGGNQPVLSLEVFGSTAPPTPTPLPPPPPPPSPVGGFSEVIAGGSGTLYTTEPTGELRWYRDLRTDGTNAPDGSTGWTPTSGQQVGCGWEMFSHVFSGGAGILYGIEPDGDLRFYRDLAGDGSNGPCGDSGWTAGSGARIGTGWDMFSRVFADKAGNIYGIEPSGALRWYRDLARDGQANWAPGSGNQIGCGWQHFSQVVASHDGQIYALTSGGELRYYRDELRDGTNGPCGERGWDPRSGSTMVCGWDPDAPVLADGSGVLYVVAADGALHWHARSWLPPPTGDGTCASPLGEWSAGSGQQIWTGFTRT